MNIVIEQMPAYRIAYIRKIGPYGMNNVEAMEELKKWAKDNELFNDEAIILGIAQDNPALTIPEDCRYDTGIVVSNDYSITGENISEGHLKGGNYAIYQIDHTAEAVQQAWIDIFSDLISQGYHLDESRPIIERYQAKLVKLHHCEICLPVC